MNWDDINFNLNAYKEHDQILDAADFIIHQYGLEHENLIGFGFRPELEKDSILLTAEGEVGEQQKVMIPKNLFDFDLTLVLNMLAHEMLHVHQKSPQVKMEDKNEREFQAYYEMLFHKHFPQIPELPDYYKIFFGEKALIYFQRMGEGSELQQKYADQKKEIEDLINNLLPKT